MKITPDTNVLVRAAFAVSASQRDDGLQAERARALLAEADLIVVTIPALCEFVWVLRSVYKVSNNAIAAAIQALCADGTVSCSRPAVEAGLSMLSAGGDFADGVIAWLGEESGAEVFVSFDVRAVRLLTDTGRSARLVS